jgi:hypothetical protein
MPSFGAQSAAGIRFVVRRLTPIEIRRRRERNVFDWSADAVQGKLRGDDVPSMPITF